MATTIVITFMLGICTGISVMSLFTAKKVTENDEYINKLITHVHNIEKMNMDTEKENNDLRELLKKQKRRANYFQKKNMEVFNGNNKSR